VVRRLESLPGVISAAPAENLVLAGGGATVRLTTDASGSDGSGTLSVSTVRVGPRYFSTLGVRILQGREFDDRDRTGAPRVTIANDVLARRLCPDRPCIGRSVFLGGEPHEIVGVVKDERYYNAGDSPLPSAYLSYWQPKPGDAFGKDARLLVRVSGSAASMMSVIRRETAAVDPMVPISEDYPLLDRIAFTFGRVRMIRTLMVTMSSMALLLSAVGLYGMLAFAVTQRTREMAIRMALGADRAGVRRLVVRDGLRVGLAGVAVGLVGAWLAARLLAGQLYGLESHDLPTFAAASAILLLVALAASYLPARRATSVSPLSALRYE
jgi:predicted permease